VACRRARSEHSWCKQSYIFCIFIYTLRSDFTEIIICSSSSGSIISSSTSDKLNDDVTKRRHWRGELWESIMMELLKQKNTMKIILKMRNYCNAIFCALNFWNAELFRDRTEKRNRFQDNSKCWIKIMHKVELRHLFQWIVQTIYCRLRGNYNVDLKIIHPEEINMNPWETECLWFLHCVGSLLLVLPKRPSLSSADRRFV
jgi:hypothetical protein